MQKEMRSLIEKYHMLQPGDTLVVGVSGGADSVFLLRLLCELRTELRISVMAAHIEHGIRGAESVADADFVNRLCAELSVPYRLYKVQAPDYAKAHHLTLEEAARQLRYDCLFDACSRYGTTKLAVAHHANDNAETMLFHLVRGTGLRGMAGMSPVSTQKRGDACYQVLRPLLAVTREEIESYLDGHGYAYRTDATNADLSYTRNYIRSRVMPELATLNPRAVSHMGQLSAQMQELNDFLREEMHRLTEGVWEKEVLSDGTMLLRIHCAAQKALHPFLQKRLIHQLLCLQAGSSKDIAAVHVEEVMALSDAAVGKQTSLPYGMVARREYEFIVLKKEETDDKPCPLPETFLLIPGETALNDGRRIRTELLSVSEFFGKIPQKQYTKWFDYDKIKSTVLLRGRRTGDYLHIDATGRTKTIKKYLIEEKIPQKQRDSLFLLADGDHIIWVIGHRISEAYKVTDATKRVLKVQLLLPAEEIFA